MCEEGGGAVVLEEAAAKALAAALGPHKATIHRNHGLFTVGHTVDEAAWWFITMERSCQAQLLAEAAGTPVIIDDEGARYTRDFSASPYSGWLSFQPLWDEISRQRARPLRLSSSPAPLPAPDCPREQERVLICGRWSSTSPTCSRRPSMPTPSGTTSSPTASGGPTPKWRRGPTSSRHLLAAQGIGPGDHVGIYCLQLRRVGRDRLGRLQAAGRSGSTSTTATSRTSSATS